jgi:hypothetical protein
MPLQISEAFQISFQKRISAADLMGVTQPEGQFSLLLQLFVGGDLISTDTRGQGGHPDGHPFFQLLLEGSLENFRRHHGDHLLIDHRAGCTQQAPIGNSVLIRQ